MGSAIWLFGIGVSFMVAAAGCSAPFPTGDISKLVKSKTGAYLTDSTASYSVYGGYDSECAHPGVHAEFPAAGTYPIYAVADGVVSQVDSCSTAGENDKFDISLAIGMKGAVPVFFEYSVEPFGGSVCDGDQEHFENDIFVKVGDTVKKGEKIGVMRAVGAGAHIHFNLKVDGATVCPDIFSASLLAAKAGAQSGCVGAPASTFCYELTDSEDPSQLTK